jgi:hypothetical protein
VRNQAQQSALDDILGQADFDRRLFTLRSANPHLAFELDELARAFRRVRDRIAMTLFDEAPPARSTDAASHGDAAFTA